MPACPNPRHESFAQARFRGMSVMDAYRAAGYEGETPQVASKVSQHPEVKARLMELYNAAAKVMAYERLDAIQDLLTIIKARPSEGGPDHPLCEVRTGRNGEYHRFPSKLRAMARLVKIMGWDEPLKVEVEHEAEAPDRMTVLLTEMRSHGRVEDAAMAEREDELDAKSAPKSADAPLTPRQEAFARARFSGMGVMEAYQAAGYVGNSPDRASRVNQHPPVKARLAQLRQAAEATLPYKKHEAANDLIAIVHASPEEAGPENPLCEMRMGHEGPYYRFPCKLQAMLLLAKLMGWHAPEKVQITVGVRKMDRLDQLQVWVNARAEREQREKARKKAAMLGRVGHV